MRAGCIPANGTGTSGEYCSHDKQCKTVGCFDNKCSKPVARALPLGKQCNTNADCSSGACDAGGVVPTRTCVPLNNTGLGGSYCAVSEHCKGNLVCDFRGDEPKCAAPYGELGDSCWIYGRLPIAGLNNIHIQQNKTQCKSLRCDWDSMTCIPNDGEGKVEDYCTHANHCKNKNCVGFHCAAPAALGQSCETNPGCSSGACDTAKKKCVPVNGTGNTGEFCTASSHCKSSSCKSGACESKAALGQYCGDGRACGSGRCDNFNERKCIPNDGTGDKGDYCTHNNQCKSKNCPVPGPGKGTTCR